MPPGYEYKEFDWLNSVAGEKLQNNTVQSKHHVNEVAETPRALHHLKN
jgi:hypothetical protein